MEALMAIILCVSLFHAGAFSRFISQTFDKDAGEMIESGYPIKNFLYTMKQPQSNLETPVKMRGTPFWKRSG